MKITKTRPVRIISWTHALERLFNLAGFATSLFLWTTIFYFFYIYYKRKNFNFEGGYTGTKSDLIDIGEVKLPK